MAAATGKNTGIVLQQMHYQPILAIQGGMGLIFKCRDSDTDRFVALKTFKPRYLSLRIVRERFLDEAVNWILLGDHPNIVTALTITQVDTPPQPCIVLEWIEGRYTDADASLGTVLNRRRRRPLGFAQSLNVAIGIARGMHHATETLPGFVHNDLKPENILIDSDWRPLVTDMGMSHSLASITGSRHAGDQPPSPLFPCTPGFCAPEQFEPDFSVDQRADIYSLGCILFEMLTGQRINPGEDEEMRKRLDHEGGLREIPDALPASIRDVISRCICQDPAGRYGNWQDLEKALTACYHQCTGYRPPAAETREIDADEMARQRSISFLALGKSFFEFGDMAKAIDYINQGLDLAQSIEHSELESELLYQRSVVLLDSGKLEQASDDLNAALKIILNAEQQELLADLLSMLGMLYVRREEYEKAMNFLQQALEVAQKSGNHETEAMVLGNLGSAYGQSGNPAKAIEYFRDLLDWCDASEDELLRTQTLASLGIASYDLKQYAVAIDHLNQALKLCRQHGDDPGSLHVLKHLWQSYAAMGNNKEASSRKLDYENLARELGRNSKP